MAKIKGIKKVNKIINDFTKSFGVKAYLNVDFEAVLAAARVILDTLFLLMKKIKSSFYQMQ